MTEQHAHAHHQLDASSISRAFYIGIVLNAIFTAIEFIVGHAYDSLALLADASHNLSDVASLIISLAGMKLAQKAASKAYTYGYKKASIIASLINAVLLIVIVFIIFKEAYERLNIVHELQGSVLIITALVGVLINAVSAYLFFRAQKHDINVKGAFIHLLVDALVSIGVVIAGIVIHFTHWHVVDPLISFVIGIVVLISTWGLLKESIKLTLDGIPGDIDPDVVRDLILKEKSVVEIRHMHIWALSSTENALTCHLILDKNYTINETTALKESIRHQLEHGNIHHATLEFDSSSSEGQHELNT